MRTKCVGVLHGQHGLGHLGHRVSVAQKYIRINHIGYNFNISVNIQTITQMTQLSPQRADIRRFSLGHLRQFHRPANDPVFDPKDQAFYRIFSRSRNWAISGSSLGHSGSSGRKHDPRNRNRTELERFRTRPLSILTYPQTQIVLYEA